MIPNFSQRTVLFAAAIVATAVWGFEVQSQGLEESHWIAAILLIAGMLLVALSTKQSHSKARSATTPDKVDFARNKTDEGEEIVAVRFDACYEQWEEFLVTSLIDRNPKMSVLDRSALIPFMKITALKLAFANYIQIIFQRSPDAGQSEDAKALRLRACSLLSRRIFDRLDNLRSILPDSPPPDREESVDMATNYLLEYELLVISCQKKFEANASFPLDPVYKKVAEDAQLELLSAADRDTFFGIKYRQEIGRLLHPKAGITAL